MARTFRSLSFTSSIIFHCHTSIVIGNEDTSHNYNLLACIVIRVEFKMADEITSLIWGSDQICETRPQMLLNESDLGTRFSAFHNLQCRALS